MSSRIGADWHFLFVLYRAMWGMCCRPFHRFTDPPVLGRLDRQFLLGNHVLLKQIIKFSADFADRACLYVPFWVGPAV